jgi:hypothetical protein
MLSDWELWACALEVEKQHGVQSPQFISERLVALARAGDEDGALAWTGISNRYDQLQR